MNDFNRWYNELLGEEKPIVPYIRDKNRPFISGNDMPHYTNSLFKKAQTVFLDKDAKLVDGYVVGATYNYSDRLSGWHSWDHSQKAWEQAREKHPFPRSPLMYETYLRLLLEYPNLELVHVLAGYNLSNGYSYQCFGYITNEGKSNE